MEIILSYCRWIDIFVIVIIFPQPDTFTYIANAVPRTFSLGTSNRYQNKESCSKWSSSFLGSVTLIILEEDYFGFQGPDRRERKINLDLPMLTVMVSFKSEDSNTEEPALDKCQPEELESNWLPRINLANNHLGESVWIKWQRCQFEAVLSLRTCYKLQRTKNGMFSAEFCSTHWETS